ncbi:hypothetical protein C0Q70_21623 [Pomacea canaliculata]|uniref:Methylosome subunit pICln n=1 Tax=Pomacea canaliculata TaxID=400727 RepID=A0A2T7ND20_POMCA|nr:methylosome subunit pICln-like isoform X2 [Pomacea canaliculata]PVD19064.1 hypothetical protein C0Q70_21623 [Pomacea canaliculata]
MVLLTNFSPPTEGIRHCQVNTSVDVDGKDLGNGTLYIAESCVSWQKDSTCTGFSLQYPGISLHAISRDLTSFPSECLYLMIDGKLPGAEEEKEASSSEDEDSESKITEMRFIPADKDALESMYKAMSACQALHPDPEDIDSEEEEEKYAYEEEEEEDDGVYEEEEGAAHLTPAGRARLAQFDALLQGGDPGEVLPSANGYHRPAPIMGIAGDGCSADEPMELGQFQDADEME